MNNSKIDYLAIGRGLVGAAIGGVIGFYAFNWILSQGFYALALPGALLGGGCGILSRVRSATLAILCAISGFFLGVFCEWWNWPLTADKSFLYFVKNLHCIDSQMTWVLIILGTLIAGWFGFGRDYLTASTQKNEAAS